MACGLEGGELGLVGLDAWRDRVGRLAVLERAEVEGPFWSSKPASQLRQSNTQNQKLVLLLRKGGAKTDGLFEISYLRFMLVMYIRISKANKKDVGGGGGRPYSLGLGIEGFRVHARPSAVILDLAALLFLRGGTE